MKKKLLAFVLLAGGSLFAGAEAFVDIGIAPPPPVAVRVRPVRPSRGHVWVAGYWYPEGSRYRWHEGYWALPPHGGAHWVAPRYRRHRYYAGYWR
jgi:hypothetical protein